MTDAERYELLVDEIDYRREQITDLEKDIKALIDELYEYKKFARWCAWCLFDENSKFPSSFSEEALTKLLRLGIVKDEDESLAFEWNENEDWYKEIIE